MSLRVAVAFANTLIHQLKILGAGMHLSDVYGARASPHLALRATLSRREREQGGDFLWLHSTKKHELFVRGFGKFQNLWPEATHVTVEDFLEKISSTLSLRDIPPPKEEGTRKVPFFCGELIPEHEALFKDKELFPLTLQPLMDVLPTFLAQLHYEQKLLEPWYGRGW